MQAWLFYIALVLFPLWWVGAFWRVPKTRVVGGTDTEKAVPLDDPQIEFGALESFFFQFFFETQRDQMRGLGGSAVELWRPCRWSPTSRLSSLSRSLPVGETMPASIDLRFSSPRFLGSGTVS